MEKKNATDMLELTLVWFSHLPISHLSSGELEAIPWSMNQLNYMKAHSQISAGLVPNAMPDLSSYFSL